MSEQIIPLTWQSGIEGVVVDPDVLNEVVVVASVTRDVVERVEVD